MERPTYWKGKKELTSSSTPKTRKLALHETNIIPYGHVYPADVHLQVLQTLNLSSSKPELVSQSQAFSSSIPYCWHQYHFIPFINLEDSSDSSASFTFHNWSVTNPVNILSSFPLSMSYFRYPSFLTFSTSSQWFSEYTVPVSSIRNSWKLGRNANSWAHTTPTESETLGDVNQPSLFNEQSDDPCACSNLRTTGIELTLKNIINHIL